MTRLLILATLFVGSLAMYPSGGSYEGSSYGGGGWDGSSKIQGSGGNKEVVEISIHLISEGQGGSAPIQNIASPMKQPGQIHTVVVGGSAGLVYTPETISAEIGDMVQFNFMSKNHTVTQSTFPLPCVKMAGGKDSGFKPNPDDSMNPPPSFVFQVMTKKPIWFYCRQKGHCGMGMTFSINPTADKSQAIFKQMAIEQNGTASGVPPASSPPYPMSSSTVVTAPAATAPVVTAPPPASTELPVIAPPPPPPVNNNGGSPPASTPPNSMVSGSGSGGSGACECSCFCGTAAFPPGVGIGMWGGLPGSVPA